MLKIKRRFADNEKMKSLIDNALSAKGISAKSKIEDGELIIEILAKPQELFGFNIVDIVNNVQKL